MFSKIQVHVDVQSAETKGCGYVTLIHVKYNIIFLGTPKSPFPFYCIGQ